MTDAPLPGVQGLTTAQPQLPAAVLLGDGVRQQQHLVLEAAGLPGKRGQRGGSVWSTLAGEAKAKAGPTPIPERAQPNRGKEVNSGQMLWFPPVLQLFRTDSGKVSLQGVFVGKLLCLELVGRCS